MGSHHHGPARVPGGALIRLYTDYARTALTRDWVRLFMFSGLKGEAINQRYRQFLRSRVLEPLATELRAELGLPTPQELPLTEAEIELVWGINARIFYFGQRRWIVNVPQETELEPLIALTIRPPFSGRRPQRAAGAVRRPGPPGAAGRRR